MNNLKLVILVVLSLFLSKCYYNSNRSIDNSSKTIPTVKFIAVEFDGSLDQIGYYYSYDFNSLTKKIDDVKEYLSILVSKGFKIKTAWYFGGGSCGNTNTYIEPQFIIQLEKNDFGLIDYNFTSLSEKPKLACNEQKIKYIPTE